MRFEFQSTHMACACCRWGKQEVVPGQSNQTPWAYNTKNSHLLGVRKRPEPYWFHPGLHFEIYIPREEIRQEYFHSTSKWKPGP